MTLLTTTEPLTDAHKQAIADIVRVLRTTTKLQTVGRMYNPKECSYCAQGVIIKELINPDMSVDYLIHNVGIIGHLASIPEYVLSTKETEFLNLILSNRLFATIIDTIIHMNDSHRMTFTQIADALEAVDLDDKESIVSWIDIQSCSTQYSK